MLTILINAVVKKDCLNDFIELAKQLTKETRNVRAGNVAYAFLKKEGADNEFVLFEQWESEAHLQAHIAELIKLLGKPKPGGVLPERLVNMYESATPSYYTPVA